MEKRIDECTRQDDIYYLSDENVIENIFNFFRYADEKYHKVIAVRAADEHGYFHHWNLVLYYYQNPPTYPMLKWEQFYNIGTIIQNDHGLNILAFVIVRVEKGIAYETYTDIDVLTTDYDDYQPPSCPFMHN